MEEADLWYARQAARAKRRAMELPVDYQDLAFVQLKSVMGGMQREWPEVHYRFFVSLFDQDIDPALAERLADAGIPVEAGSAYYDASEQNEAGQLPVRTRTMSIWIKSIESVGNGTYRIHHGYHCGTLCAGGLESDLRFEDGGWKVLETRGLWFE
jgi:hypothetical protein